MKKIPATLALVCNIAVAGPQPCDVWEYARLKDSTAEELTAHACASSKIAKENTDEKWALLSTMNVPLFRSEEVARAEAVCKDQVKVTKSVFLQKFGKALRDEECAALVGK